VFTLPEPYIQEAVATVPGLDGQKMSKSHGNTIEVFGDINSIDKKIKSIVMDSRSPTEPKPDADKNIAIQLLKLLAPPASADYDEQLLRDGQMGYGRLKANLIIHYHGYFKEYREKYLELKKNPDYVEDVLVKGALRASLEAEKTMVKVRKAVGL